MRLSLPAALRCLLLIALTLPPAGCATLLSGKGKSKKPQKATAANPVDQILCLWEPSEGRDPEGRPCRGFAGQIMFLTKRSASPVIADGEVRVYLFDDQGTAEEQTKPLRQFDFPNEVWNMHRKTGTLGATYQCFIPYTRPGNHEAACALRVRFTPPGQGSPTVFSEMATVNLKGRESNIAAKLAGPAPDPIAPVEARKIRSTTIDLERGTAREGIVTRTVKPANEIHQVTHEEPAGDAAEAPAAATPEQRRIAELERKLEALAGQRQLATQSAAPARTTVMAPPAQALQQAVYETPAPDEAPGYQAPPRQSPPRPFRPAASAAPAANRGAAAMLLESPDAAPSDDAANYGPPSSNRPAGDDAYPADEPPTRIRLKPNAR